MTCTKCKKSAHSESAFNCGAANCTGGPGWAVLTLSQSVLSPLSWSPGLARMMALRAATIVCRPLDVRQCVRQARHGAGDHGKHEICDSCPGTAAHGVPNPVPPWLRRRLLLFSGKCLLLITQVLSQMSCRMSRDIFACRARRTPKSSRARSSRATV